MNVKTIIPRLLILFTLCVSASAGAKEKIVLKVYDVPRRDASGVVSVANRAIIDRFEELNPEIRLVPFSGLTAVGMSSDVGILLALAGGIAPDVLYVNFNLSYNYIHQGFLYPLDQFVERMSADEYAQLQERVPAQAWPVIKQNGGDGKEHIWAIPNNTLVMALLYRKDVFAKAGLDPEKPPENWDELYQYAKKITDPQKGVYGIMLESGQSAAWHLMSFIWSAGADVVTPDSEGNWEAVFNSWEAVDAFSFFRRLTSEKWDKNGTVIEGVALQSVGSENKWTQGKVGMKFQYLDEKLVAKLQPELIGVAPVPAGPRGQRGSEINCTMMGINATVTDPGIREAAWKYILFVDSPEARRIRTRIYVENGYAQFVNPAFLERYGYREYLDRVPRAWVDAYNESMKNGHPEPYGKNCDVLYFELAKPLEKIILKDYSGRTEQQIRTDIKAILDKAVVATNIKMLERVPPDVKRFRTRIAFVVALVVFVTFTVLLVKINRIFSGQIQAGLGKSGFRKHRLAYLLLAPAMLSILLWQYLPLVRGSVMAFLDYRIVGQSKFVGLDNFAVILFDGQFWLSLLNTLKYVALSMALTFFPPILLAVLLQEVPVLLLVPL